MSYRELLDKLKNATDDLDFSTADVVRTQVAAEHARHRQAKAKANIEYLLAELKKHDQPSVG